MGKVAGKAAPPQASSARLWALLGASAALALGAWIVTQAPSLSAPSAGREGRDALRDAKVAFVDGDLAEAERLLRPLPGSEARTLLGRVLLERGQNDEASQIFGQLLKEDAHNFDATRGMALAAQRMDRLDLAVLYRIKATELQAKDPRVWKDLGLCLRQKGDTIGALNALQQSLSLDPNQPELSSRISELAAANADFARAASPGGLDALVPRPREPSRPGLPGRPTETTRTFPLSPGFNR